MIKKFTKLLNIVASLLIGSLILWNCEPDADQLGSQFFQNGATGNEDYFDVIAYNVFHGTPGVLNSDSIRTDATRLQSATLGAFREPQFGLQKSSYVSQVRLSAYSPDFGTNPVLDSAVLVIKPLYASDSVRTTTQEDYIYPDGALPAKKVVNTYPILKYGQTKLNGKTIFNIKVQEVTQFLFANTDAAYSNKEVSTGSVIGGRAFNGDISSVKITRDSDNSELFNRDANLRIPLDSTFFQNKIIKASAADLADAASFIRYFRGVKLSVDENDGYLFNFDPNSVTINLYYKKNKAATTTGEREAATFALDLGAANAHFNQITFDRTNTPSAAIVQPQNMVDGEPTVFAQGMGGPGVGLKIRANDIAVLRDMFNNEKIGIVSAKLRLYTDVNAWNNNFKKPNYFVVKQQGLDTFLEDMTTLAYAPNFSLVKGFDLDKNPAHYDIAITQTLKNIIEKNVEPKDLIINVGTYTTDASGGLAGLVQPEFAQTYNTRAYTPNRVVLVGTRPGDDRGAKLVVTYGKK